MDDLHASHAGHFLIHRCLRIMQFHYLSLLSYGKAVRIECRETQRMLVEAQEACQREIKDKSQLHAQLRQAINQIEEFKPMSAKLEKWTQREPRIMHYLNGYNDMTVFDHLIPDPKSHQLT